MNRNRFAFRGILAGICLTFLSACPREYGVRLDPLSPHQRDVIDDILMATGDLPSRYPGYGYDWEDLNADSRDELIVQIYDRPQTCTQPGGCPVMILTHEADRDWRVVLRAIAASDFPVFVDCDGQSDWCQIATITHDQNGQIQRRAWRYDPGTQRYTVAG